MSAEGTDNEQLRKRFCSAAPGSQQGERFDSARQAKVSTTSITKTKQS